MYNTYVISTKRRNQMSQLQSNPIYCRIPLCVRNFQSCGGVTMTCPVREVYSLHPAQESDPTRQRISKPRTQDDDEEDGNSSDDDDDDDDDDNYALGAWWSCTLEELGLRAPSRLKRCTLDALRHHHRVTGDVLHLNCVSPLWPRCTMTAVPNKVA